MQLKTVCGRIAGRDNERENSVQQPARVDGFLTPVDGEHDASDF
ncbi:MAG TPA: hypothetical protein VGJ48_04765 [Pyrinomonadaceae bacterium]|jgi:hypothetical protein